MTEFNGVTRKTAKEYRTLYPKARPIVVRLARGDMIEFREHGRRQWFALPVVAAFREAIKRRVGIFS